VADEHQDLKQSRVNGAVSATTITLGCEIGAIAQLACSAAGARGCLIVIRRTSGDGSVWADADSPPRELDDPRITELINRWMGDGASNPISRPLTPSDAAVLHVLAIETKAFANLTLWHHCEGQPQIFVVLISMASGNMTKSVAALAARCSSAVTRDQYHSQQSLFWRGQAGQLRDDLNAVRTAAARATRENASEAALNRRLAANAQRGNLGAIASVLGRLGLSEGWIIATQDGGGLRVTDVCGVPRDALGDAGSELKRPQRTRTIASRNLGQGRDLSVGERRFQRLGYRGYLRLSWDGGVLILLSRRAVDAAARARVSNCFAVIRPYLENLFLSRELERQRVFVRSLVRGLFATADTERANLRRDLHDDWAQLLAAAQIAVNGDREDARRFFRELEGELRKRLLALRPSPSRQGNLKVTVEAELARLGQAGIEATSRVRNLHRLPATVKEALARVIGEGVSNVIRHAGANRVQIEIGCSDGIASAAVIDDGQVSLMERPLRVRGCADWPSASRFWVEAAN
jgi:signal transduction histidine kinase